MFLNTWIRISYMVQILAACGVFLFPAKKRRPFPPIVIGSSLIMTCISYLITGIMTHLWQKQGSIIFWSFYIISAIVFILVNMCSSVLEAVFVGVICCGVQHIAYDLCLIAQLALGMNTEEPGSAGAFLLLLIYLATYAASYWLLAKKLAHKGHYTATRGAVLPLAIMMILVWGISVAELSTSAGFEAGVYNHIIYRILDSLCCIFVLWVQIDQKEKTALQRELDGINAAARQQQMQYRRTSETIESINRRCHDLKHQVRALRECTDKEHIREYLDEIENDVMIYDTAVQTGNKALDTVLMEKGLFCRDHNIQWTAMADGVKLSFMKIEDIYAIFGNALDNAVSAVMKLKDEDKRVISVKILEQNRLVLIQVQNYYEGTLRFENGLPLTTKKNKYDHGFGMKSIQHIAESYNGTMAVQANDGIFMLQILIPVPDTAV